ncbi:MAG TPA: efflux RND transporter periplasmic adaptor subunit [Syntrophothermus lipocalidus]|uniref:Efflux transporter, RND family, MFP subunit n=1 Tax=Syntrophothermus lipocalidus (strain DSM 12680 / TGB-C1) TaxID=643648 RepID=D7CJC8_SYNLT|nr:efflux RND transporter periplasmic adaptor subunit [Syntrophothermus lipocalidus]ADI01017.1 efflux transporter, RND family, MFP subunit [Syntrophothermus lipocalidus DSM 12680]HHV77671.1 efflux RND transporter periplasmic adaptor subunit [Syntrophothermus lipocalidus]
MPQIPFNQRNKVIIGVTMTAIVALLFGINIYRFRQKEVLEVQTAVVRKAPLVANIFTTGTVVVRDKEVITAKTSGIVQDVKVKVGDQVKAGQVLLQFNDRDLILEAQQAEAALMEARAQAVLQAKGETEPAVQQAKLVYDNAKEKLKRNQELYAAGAISLEQLEAAQLDADLKKSQYESALAQAAASRQSYEARVRQAEASWKLAVNRLQAARIAAPCDGTILARTVEKGQFVSAGTALFTIGNLSSLEVQADISEVDVLRLAVGQDVEITGEPLGTNKYRGRVKDIAPRAENKIKNQSEQTIVPVTIGVIGNAELLRPGYNVDLNITTARRKAALVVPYEAIVEDGNESAVFVVKDGVARKRQVRTGISDEMRVEILDGVSSGDRVILNPPEKLEDGSLVRSQ